MTYPAPGAILELYAGRAAGGVGPGSGTLATWADVSGFARHAALSGFAYTAGSGWSGSGSDADPHVLTFDGANDYIVTPAFTAAGAGLTIELEVKPTSSVGDYSWRALASHMSYGVTGWLIYAIESPGALGLYAVGSKGGGLWAVTLDAPGVLPVGSWRHVALTFDNAARLATLYVAGAAVLSLPMDADVIMPAGVAFAVNDAALPVPLAVRTVRYYERALSALEIAQNAVADVPAPTLAKPAPTLGELAVSAVQRPVVRCVAYQGDSIAAELDVAGGSVTADARRTILRDASLELSTEELDADDLFSLLCTPGVELLVSRGFVLGDGSELLAPLGRFVPEEPELAESAAGKSVSVSCSDVAIRVQRARWTAPYVIDAGTPLAAALAELLSDRWPAIQLSITAELAPESIGAKIVLEAGDNSDPWADACRIAGAHGYTLFPDPTGVVTIRSVAPPAGDDGIFTFPAGATAIITETRKSSPLARTYNGVIASGEGSGNDTPVRGEAWDENPSSPTYRYGPLGQIPAFYSSPLLKTAEQCETAAAKILAGYLGRVEVLEWRSAVHPGLAPLDVVRVEQRNASFVSYVLDSLTYPLTLGEAMSATTREVVEAY